MAKNLSLLFMTCAGLLVSSGYAQVEEKQSIFTFFIGEKGRLSSEELREKAIVTVTCDSKAYGMLSQAILSALWEHGVPMDTVYLLRTLPILGEKDKTRLTEQWAGRTVTHWLEFTPRFLGSQQRWVWMALFSEVHAADPFYRKGELTMRTDRSLDRLINELLPTSREK